ncbi:MAG: right-handed parallel beta-helix repeat-containing protein, partial [Burkholderiales bacterium]|nr:right-handed parallel beta-helix repeat-containing protein [Burkholderiales bacterium]
YGNTAQASKSPAQFLLVITPNGGESVPQDTSYEIRWRSTGFGGNVTIEYSSSTGGPSWQTLSANEINDGSYLWSVDPAIFAVGERYLIRVSSVDAPSIADQSNATFSVTPPINVFYVNDGSLDGDQYTTAIGDDANDGLTAATPKATIRGILEAYDLDDGDLIRVDTGVYNLTANIVLDAQDSGVTIEGPTLEGRQAVINRGNTASTAYVFQLNGADDVTLRSLLIRGGYYGVYAANGVGSDDFTIEGSWITGNSQTGIYIAGGNADARITDNEIYGNGAWGISVDGSGARAVGNHVWGNANGISASNNGAAARIEISGNTVHDQSGVGIAGSYWVLVDGNKVYGNGGSYGIYIYSSSGLAIGNEIYRNAGDGLTLSVGGVGRDNRIYANAASGIELGGSGGGTAEGNIVYRNNVGISESQSRVANNLVYDNVVAGIVTSGYRDSSLDGIFNNTVVQPTGDAIRVANSGTNVLIRNNILEVGAGYAIYVPSNAQVGFVSDYNLFRLTGGARLGYWEDRDFSTRADWFYEIGHDGESVVADPEFLDPAGADGIRGYGTIAIGSATVIDSGNGGFSVVGAWEERLGRTNEPGPPPYTATPLERTIYNTATDNDIHWIPGGGDGSSVARWTFGGLEDGTYQIAVRWPTGQGLSPTTTNYRIYDGVVDVANVTAQASRYQGDVLNDFTDGDGVSWESLETVEIRNGQLVVEVSNAGGNASSRIVADAVRIQRIQGDHGVDDDFHLDAGSVAVDRGDPTSRYDSEPASNGGRVDLGAYGNTPEAAQSPARMVQVVNPNGLEKFEVGQSVVIDYRTAGLGLFDPVLLMNAGGQIGYWAPQSGVSSTVSPLRTTTIAAATAIDLSGVTNPAPADVYRSISYVDGGAGRALSYLLPVADGDYEIVLHFIEPTLNTVGQRVFDIALQGATVRADVDVRALAGAVNRAVTLRFDVTASGGGGIDLDLINKLGQGGAMISGIEVLRANAGGVANPTVDLAYSIDGGGTWNAIASGLAVDAYGRGSFDWSAGPLTGNALIRATAHAGAVTVNDVSDEPFQLANAGTAYFVNDNSTAGDEYTTAVGNNANDGKTAATPMASLAALLRAYDLDANDIIYVDTGVYSLTTNILLDAQDSGVTIQGAQQSGHATVLNRGNTAGTAFVIEMAGADDVTLRHLTLTGASSGFVVANV